MYVQSLLKSHEKAENEIRSYGSEIDRLKELSRKVVEGSTTAPPHYVRKLYHYVREFLVVLLMISRRELSVQEKMIHWRKKRLR